MKIETKYNVGDSVYVMYKNKITSARISHLEVQTFENNINYPIEEYIFYLLNSEIGSQLTHPCNNAAKKFNERSIFKTKEELIKLL